MKLNLLITCVGGELVPELIRNLKSSSIYDVTIFGVDADSMTPGRHFCDDFKVVPKGNDTNYVSVISDYVKSNNINLIIPTSDEEALSLSKNRDSIESDTCTLACTNEKVLELISDKSAAYRFFEEKGFNTPFWIKISNYEELIENIEKNQNSDKSFVIKPVSERGGRNVFILSEDVKEIKTFSKRREVHMNCKDFMKYPKEKLGNLYPVIMMEKLEEPVYDIDLLGWQGTPLRVIPRRRIDSGVPNEGHIIVDNPDLIELGEKIINVLNLSWLYDCDIMYNKEGQAFILEINPRQSGSVAVSIAAGAPLLEDLIALANGDDIQNINIKYGQRILPFKSLYVDKNETCNNNS